MATWMNDGEIDRAVAVLSKRAPNLAPYAVLLSEWRDVVNANSDGWSHWVGGSRPASRLMDHIQAAVECLQYGRGEMPTETQMRSAVTPIKAVATRRGFRFPELRFPSQDVAPQVAAEGHAPRF